MKKINATTIHAINWFDMKRNRRVRVSRIYARDRSY